MLVRDEFGSVVGPPPEAHALVYVSDPRRLVHGNRVRLLRDGSEAFAAMLEAIDAAGSYVHLESYIFRADRTGQAFAARLLAARQRGAQVAVIFDSLGSRGFPDEFAARLVAAGIQLLGNPVARA